MVNILQVGLSVPLGTCDPYTDDHDASLYFDKEAIELAQGGVDKSSDEQFEALLDQLGVKDLVQSELGNDAALRAMWENLTSDPNPEMLAAFEEVLAKLTGDLQRRSSERKDLETTLKIRNRTQEEHLQVLRGANF